MRIKLTPDQEQFLRANPDESPTTLARTLGYHIDTVKRIQVRLGIKTELEYAGAKYHRPSNSVLKTWNRPCTTCKSTTTRPKWQFRCDRCHRRQSSGVDPDL